MGGLFEGSTGIPERCVFVDQQNKPASYSHAYQLIYPSAYARLLYGIKEAIRECQEMLRL